MLQWCQLRTQGTVAIQWSEEWKCPLVHSRCPDSHCSADVQLLHGRSWHASQISSLVTTGYWGRPWGIGRRSSTIYWRLQPQTLGYCTTGREWSWVWIEYCRRSKFLDDLVQAIVLKHGITIPPLDDFTIIHGSKFKTDGRKSNCAYCQRIKTQRFALTVFKSLPCAKCLSVIAILSGTSKQVREWGNSGLWNGHEDHLNCWWLHAS